MPPLFRMFGDDLQFHRSSCAGVAARDVSACRWSRLCRGAEWSGDGERSPDRGEAVTAMALPMSPNRTS